MTRMMIALALAATFAGPAWAGRYDHGFDANEHAEYRAQADAAMRQRQEYDERRMERYRSHDSYGATCFRCDD